MEVPYFQTLLKSSYSCFSKRAENDATVTPFNASTKSWDAHFYCGSSVIGRSLIFGTGLVYTILTKICKFGCEAAKDVVVTGLQNSKIDTTAS